MCRIMCATQTALQNWNRKEYPKPQIQRSRCILILQQNVYWQRPPIHINFRSFTDGVPYCVETDHVGIEHLCGLKGPAVYMATIPSWLLYEFINHNRYSANQNAQSVKSNWSKGNGVAMILHLKYRKSTIRFVPIDLIRSHLADSINQITCFCFTDAITLTQSVYC